MTKHNRNFGRLADDFVANRARKAAQDAGRNANIARLQFTGAFVTVRPSATRRLLDALRQFMGI